MTLPILEVLEDLQRDERAHWLLAHVEALHVPETRKTAGWFHASQLGNPDDVLLSQFRGTYIEDYPAIMQRIFDNGHDRHRGIGRTLHRAGLSVFDHWDGPEADEERRCKIEALRLRGTCDDVIKHPETGVRHLFEFKSINPFGFTMLRAPKPEHIAQVHVYMAALGLSDSIILYENKGNQAWLPFYQPFDIDVWVGITARIKRLLRIAQQNIRSNASPELKRKAAALEV